MPTDLLFRLLVPDAPMHRRTERDPLRSPEAALRSAATNFLLEVPVQPGLQAPRLVSTFEGSIDTLLFAFPTYAQQDAALSTAYRSLIAALRHGTGFIVVHPESDHDTLRSWFTDAGHADDALSFVPLPDFVSFTDWAEDGYVALEDAADGSLYLMEPWEFPRAGDALIADAVEEHVTMTASQSPLIFQGGNCLIGDDFWLLGKDYFADSVQLLQRPRPPVVLPAGTTPEDFVRRLFGEYVDSGRRLEIVGTSRAIPLAPFRGTREGSAFFLDVIAEGAGTFQPIFHIDMFITLVGRNADGEFEVLVGSPAIADEILGTRSPFGLASVYDELADQLEELGLKVRRNPLVHRPTLGQTLTTGRLRQMASLPPGDLDLLNAVNELVAGGATETTSVRVRSWHHVTWNNCLVENSTSQGRHVYLPTFGHGNHADLARVDEHMRDLWQDELGFTAHMLGDFNEFARRQGVVHCIKKYIQRGS